MEVKKVQILTFEINSVWCGGKDNYDLCNNKDSTLEDNVECACKFSQA